MAEQQKTMSKIVKPLSRGQITIPVEFRRKLKIGSDTFLSLTLKGNKIEITPAILRKMDEEDLRGYTDSEISGFLKEDKISQSTARTIRKLLAEGNL
ncbi:MAG: AbrB/MazE/SpoVT family DNA-binding domain-containing protein [Actinomycetia bacterium]|nr:AbrB/MazE/SpoVT family DNA-binding domain-containing protein [Actinomycetes bacterium]